MQQAAHGTAAAAGWLWCAGLALTSAGPPPPRWTLECAEARSSLVRQAGGARRGTHCDHPGGLPPDSAPLAPPCPLPASCFTEAFSSLVRQAAAHAEKDMVPAPDLDRHVFCRVLEDRGNVTVDEEG